MKNDWPATLQFLRSVRPLRSIAESELDRLRPCLRHRTLAKGEYVYHQGQGAEYMYFIRQGRVKVCQTANGKEMILGVYGTSELLGCCGLIGDVCYPCYAEAIEPSEIVFLSREAFHRLLSGVPTVAAELLSQMVRRLREAHCKMRSLALEPVEERVITVLLELGKKHGTRQNGRVTLPSHATRRQVSEMAGTTIETTSRVITKLRRAGLIECSKRRTILDVNPLEQIIRET